MRPSLKYVMATAVSRTFCQDLHGHQSKDLPTGFDRPSFAQCHSGKIAVALPGEPAQPASGDGSADDANERIDPD